MADNKGYFSIGIVERDTGIGRDTLRIWERRYGYPTPLRDKKGERIYPESQLRQLQRIRRLLDQGLRPGKVLPLSEADLLELEASLLPETTLPKSEAIEGLLDAIHSVDARQVESLLRKRYQAQGMQAFIVQTVAPLLHAVGELWASGRLQVYQEHFLSNHLVRFLNSEMDNMQVSANHPRILLATLPGEQHTLGTLMVAAMLSQHGLAAINLGGEVPVDQIGHAVAQFQVDVVGITFSAAYPYKNIRPHLLELRELLPVGVDIWTGGEGVRRLRKLPRGITKFNSLENLPLWKMEKANNEQASIK